MADRNPADGDDGREQALWLNELLDAAADQYEPDAERLTAMVTARIARQGSSPDSPRSPRVRRRGLGLLGRLGLAGIPAGVALATIGAAAAIAVGATATIAVTSSHDHHTVPVAGPSTSPATGGGSSSPNPEPSEGASPAATGESTRTATSSAGSTAGSTAASTSVALVAATSSIGQASSPSWSELDLSVAIRQPLTALHVTVKVSKCAGLASTGTWNSGVGAAFTEKTTTDSGGSITYEFELAKGGQVQPGTLTFAVQFDHASSGWKPQDDTYYVSARTSTSTSASSAAGAY